MRAGRVVWRLGGVLLLSAPMVRLHAAASVPAPGGARLGRMQRFKKRDRAATGGRRLTSSFSRAAAADAEETAKGGEGGRVSPPSIDSTGLAPASHSSPLPPASASPHPPPSPPPPVALSDGCIAPLPPPSPPSSPVFDYPAHPHEDEVEARAAERLTAEEQSGVDAEVRADVEDGETRPQVSAHDEPSEADTAALQPPSPRPALRCPPPLEPPPAAVVLEQPMEVADTQQHTTAALAATPIAAAADAISVDDDGDDVMSLHDSRSAAPTVRMLIDGVSESIRLDTQRSLLQPQLPDTAQPPSSSSSSHTPPSRSKPAKAGSSGRSKASTRSVAGGGGPPASTQLRLSSSSSLGLAHHTATTAAAAPPRSAVDVSGEPEDEQAKGRVPSLFHPRSREVQRRMSAHVTPAGKRRTTARPAGGGGGGDRGKRRAGGEPPPPQPSATSESSTAASERREEAASQSRFASCPVCGDSQPIALMNHHLDAECRGAEEKQPTRRATYGTADKRRKVDAQRQPAAEQAPMSLGPPSLPAGQMLDSAVEPSSSPLAELSSVAPLSAPAAVSPSSPPASPAAASSPSCPAVFSAAGCAMSSAPPSSAFFLSPQQPRALVGGSSYRSPLRPSPSRSTFRIDAPPTAAPASDAQSASQSSTQDGTGASSAALAGERSEHTITATPPRSEPLILSASVLPSPPPSAVVGDAVFASLSPVSHESADGVVASSSASPSALHPLFSMGSVSGAAFAAKKRGRLDGAPATATVRCHLRYRHPRAASSQLSSTSADDSRQLHGAGLSSPTSASCSSPLSCWEVLWSELAGGSTAASPSSPSLPRVVQRFQEPDGGGVTEVHFTCEPAVYMHPTVDFTSPQLLANHTR